VTCRLTRTLRATWGSWSAILQAAIDAPAGSIPAETHQQARQIIKKVLTGPIKVTPLDEKLGGKTVWFYEGYSRFDGVLMGGTVRGLPIIVEPVDEAGQPVALHPDEVRPVAGGSCGLQTERDTDMAPHTPHTLGACRRSRDLPRSLVRPGPDIAPHTPTLGEFCAQRGARRRRPVVRPR
jgi:hypothetical protein